MSKKKEVKNSKYLEDFLDFLKLTICRYNDSKSNVTTEEHLTQDILHELELGPSENKDKLATKLRKCRKERRIYKDYIEINQYLYEWYESQEGKVAIHKLQDILGKMRKEERNKENRFYTPRIKDETK